MKNVIGMTALALLATACATAPGGYAGAETEKAYNKALDAQRLVAVINNDDYYEIRKDNRVTVLSDAADMKLYIDTGDIAYRQTRIGGGPHGETVIFGIATPEKNKKDGFGSVEMFEGRRVGAEKDFYGEVLADGKWHVFGNWSALDAFRKGGPASDLVAAGYAASGEAVLAQPGDALIARFRSVHGTGSAPAVAAPAPAPVAPAAKAAPAKKIVARPVKKK